MKVLLADDCQSTIATLESYLQGWGYETMVASDGEQALRVLRSAAGPRLAVLDWSMPKIDGAEVCRSLRQRNETAKNYTYLIMLTGLDGADRVLQGLAAGADDYLTKPVNPRELQLRLRTGQRIVELQERVVAANRRLATVTTQDQLTNTMTRDSVLVRLLQEIQRAERSEREIAVLSVVIDQLEKHDELSNAISANGILRQLANCIRYATRSYDLVARFGKHSFLIVMPDTDSSDAVGMAERLRLSCEQELFRVEANERKFDLPITISVGVSSTSDVGFDRKRLVAEATGGAGDALAAGGDRVVLRRNGTSHDFVASQADFSQVSLDDSITQ